MREFINKDQYKKFLDDLNYHSEHQRGRVIAVAGPRGIGKTRLLEELREQGRKRSRFTYNFPSPKRYDPQEFAISLYKEIVVKHVPKVFPFGYGLLPRTSEARFKSLFLFVVASGVIVGAALLWFYLGRFNLPEPFFIYIAIAFGVLYIFTVSVFSLQFRARSRLRRFLLQLPLSSRPDINLIYDSVDRSRRIIYNEKILTQAGAEIRGIRFSKAEELSRRPYTYRELVDEFKDYLRELCKHYAGVIVTVDELDKITDTSSFKEFLTEIKDLFYMPNNSCLFILSVSEDAIEKYLRGIKDVVDSTFDEVYVFGTPSFVTAAEIVKVYLDEELRKATFAATISSVIGGIPRDLERAAVITNRTANAVKLRPREIFKVLLQHKLDEVTHACRMLRTSMKAQTRSDDLASILRGIDERWQLLVDLKLSPFDIDAASVNDSISSLHRLTLKGTQSQDLKELDLKIAEFTIPYLARNRSCKDLYSVVNEVKFLKNIPQL